MLLGVMRDGSHTPGHHKLSRPLAEECWVVADLLQDRQRCQSRASLIQRRLDSIRTQEGLRQNAVLAEGLWQAAKWGFWNK